VSRRARRWQGAWLLVALAAAGCTLPVRGREGTTHHVVLGFGVVSVHRSPAETVTATRVQALGVVVTDRPMLKVGVGYASSVVVTAVPGVDAAVEVSQRPWGPLRVDTSRVRPTSLEGERPHDPVP
jgi:hypothetical protein